MPALLPQQLKLGSELKIVVTVVDERLIHFHRRTPVAEHRMHTGWQ